MAKPHTPLALLILDGWGHREATDDNAIAAAHTPNMDALWRQCPRTLVDGSGMAVGLPDGQMGNSEVGHVNLGAGRVVYQDFTRVSKAVQDGDFFTNTALTEAVDAANANHGAVHIMGLLSPGGVHSHEDHLLAMVELAAQRGAQQIYVHGFLDGRDTPPRSAKPSIERFEQLFSRLGVGRFASLCGRYYAMDRDKRWDRIEQAWQVLVDGEAAHYADSAGTALANAYERGENDEFVKPTRIADAAPMHDGDSVIFMNFRADRARQLSHAFVTEGFDGFSAARRPQLSRFVSLTEYAKDIHSTVAFPAVSLNNVLGEWLAQHNYTQMRISETEKYAHVTFFFSGGREQEFDGETRVLVPSPQVATYDLQPEMSSKELTDKLVAAIKGGEQDVIVCNYPNGDMVGHTGDFAAAVKAIEAVDQCIGRVVAALREVGGECLITADHGNAEQMQDHATGQSHTAHTSELVPFIYVGRKATARDGGILSDIAPTMLHLLGLEQPPEMTGKTIMQLEQ
ncbi:2,3-bisphosphoglycerate-independent phosphoglycerate mutase [Pseudidiomarina piscicola]|uniref:2,3-bisphosphoglycerate-independent phosphoglycerate mutase n=1 Tax=Pseudidiomarina piscicola TaxID=2614830 RepID=A0A6S6WLR5_9GAMM|nr:2,3-bisphosphoglycerate-independent phosphoglycerate mutase [Pseudidiomarina piscicola]CAB0150673.1 2,3-bisphosphoglycerate-independent phosphoglycerate mutase [Pseudidiomarina piscicola]VZT40177.1 2,3-bisphosphoglycerate-independent phosphoglycerate mutase [Pseudomonas aeruginosa]